MSRVDREDLTDEDFVDAAELQATGLTDYRTDAISTCTSGTKYVLMVGPDRIDEASDLRVQAGDILVITGSSAADGTYTVDLIVPTVAGLTVRVAETIANSTGGTAHFRYPAGAKAVGVNPTGASNFTSQNVQAALMEIDAAISAGGLTAASHKTLRQLIHFADDGPGDGFVTAPEALQDPLNSMQPTSYTWYTDSSHATRMVREEFTWSGINPATRKLILYDGAGVALTPVLLDTFTYTGIHHQLTVRTFPAS